MKQPKVLRYFFLTEMWERFGFYTIQALLVLYMVHSLDFSDEKSYGILGEFTALAYVFPLLGGYVADRIMGYRLAVLLGGILLCVGYACVAIFSDVFIGLSLLVAGNSLLKPNISSFLGLFYDNEDPRRDAGFTIFYMGINLGSLGAVLFMGFVQQQFGWSTCFAVASIGLFFGVITYLSAYKYLENKGLSPQKPELTNLVAYLIKSPLITLGLMAITIAIYFILKHPNETNITLIIVGVFLFGGLIFLACKLHGVERQHMLALLILIISSIVYWGLYFQLFSSVNLFADRLIQRDIFGIHVPAIVFISMSSIFILLLGPILSILWEKTYKFKKITSTPMKFTYSLFFMGLALQLLVLATHCASGDQLVSPLWLVGFYFLVTLSEMLLSPIGLAMITELSPKKYSGLMMGVWFIALGFGGALSGYLSQGATIPEGLNEISKQFPIYGHAFQHSANLAYIAGAVLLMTSPILIKMMSWKKEQSNG